MLEDAKCSSCVSSRAVNHKSLSEERFRHPEIRLELDVVVADGDLLGLLQGLLNDFGAFLKPESETSDFIFSWKLESKMGIIRLYLFTLDSMLLDQARIAS